MTGKSASKPARRQNKWFKQAGGQSGKAGRQPRKSEAGQAGHREMGGREAGRHTNRSAATQQQAAVPRINLASLLVSCNTSKKHQKAS